jgi:hypothetical protein
VLAAMDFGYEKGAIEAERLHVEVYASQDAVEGATSVFRKTQAGLAGQIGFRLS